MRAIALATAAFLVIPFGSGSAHAAERQVRLSVTPNAVALDSGYLVVAVCGAEAASDALTDVATATRVTCSVDGEEVSQSTPGGESYAVVHTIVADSPYTVCVSGQAAFANSVTDEIALVSDGPYCYPVSV